MHVETWSFANAGDCSFCGKGCDEVTWLVSRSKGPKLICNECIQLVLGVLWEEYAREAIVRDPAWEGDFPDLKGDSVAWNDKRIRWFSSLLRSKPARHPAVSSTGLVCSFCSQKQNQVDKIIAGPNVYLCQDCVGEVSTVFAETQAATKSMRRSD